MTLSLNISFKENGMNKIKDPRNVLLIKPVGEGSKMWLRAIVKIGEGEYEAVDITKPQSVLSFPFEPMLSLQYYLGKYYLDNFIIDDNMHALNREYFTGFYSAGYDNDPKRVAICAKFKDGSSSIYCRQKKKYFDKKGIYKLRKFLKDNGLEPGYGSPTSSDNLIERFLDDKGVAVIPSLREGASNNNISKKDPSVM